MHIYKVPIILAVVLSGVVIPFIDYLVVVEVFYLGIPFLLLLFTSLAYLAGRLFLRKRNEGNRLFLAFIFPLVICSQFVATYLVGKVQRYRSEEIIRQIKVSNRVPGDREALGIKIENDLKSNSFIVSYTRGFMTRDVYDDSSKTWRSLGWND
jgi:hypothetical protein